MSLSKRHLVSCVLAVVFLACGGSVDKAPAVQDASDAASDASSSQSDAGADAGPICGGFDDAPSCKACQEQRCCDVSVSCAKDASCAATVECFRACSDTTCIQQCQSEHPGGADLFETWASCRLVNCGNECAKK